MTGAELLIAGTAISAYSAYSSSQDKAARMEQQAMLRREQAFQAQMASEREARLLERRGEKFMGIQKAAIGQSGTQLSGSNLLMLEETAADLKEDIQAIRHAGAYRVSTYNKEAQLDIEAASSERRAGMFNLGSSILNGAGKNPYFYDKKVKTNKGISNSDLFTGDYDFNTENYRYIS